jgi:hypothetical protein
MQLTNAPGPREFQSIEIVLQAERIDRYMPAAGKERAAAFRYYLWNCALCEAFYLPLHFSEIVCRNALHNALIARAGPTWYENATLLTILDERFRAELREAVSKERYQHGRRLTAHHVVSALTFGFWEHLATKRF